MRKRVPAANKATFLGWLRSQRTRDDPVGDIARDEESHRFIEPTSFKHLTRQLREAIHPLCTWVPDGSPIWAAWQAWREYRRGGKPTLPIKQLRVHNKKDEHGIDHETTMVWKLGRIWKRGRIRGCSRVYFLRDGDHIKIGTSTDVTSRMAGGQTMNPRELVLIGSVLGDRKLEVDLAPQIQEPARTRRVVRGDTGATRVHRRTALRSGCLPKPLTPPPWACSACNMSAKRTAPTQTRNCAFQVRLSKQERKILDLLSAKLGERPSQTLRRLVREAAEKRGIET